MIWAHSDMVLIRLFFFLCGGREVVLNAAVFLEGLFIQTGISWQ
jgi:hypothetical protein